MWFPFALFSALISASRRVYEKKLTGTFGNFTMGFVIQAFSLLPTVVLFFFLPLPDDVWHMPWQFWWPLLIIWFVLYPIQTYFLYRAMREGEISQVTPVMATLPVFNAITSFFLLGETPSFWGMIGIASMVAGVYYLMTDTQKGEQKYSTPVILMLLANVCIAIGSTLDKISIQASTPVFYSFMNTFGASVIFIILMYFYKQHDEGKHIKTFFWPLALLGIFQALSYTSSMMAFENGPTAYVLSVRSGSFMFASLFGFVFLKETFSNKKKIAFLLFIVGIVFLALG